MKNIQGLYISFWGNEQHPYDKLKFTMLPFWHLIKIGPYLLTQGNELLTCIA